jgi:transcriptional regulator
MTPKVIQQSEKMYAPANFRVGDTAEIVSLIRSHPLGLMMAPGADLGFFVSANLVPFVIDDEGRVLRAHVARANPLISILAEPREVLVVFQGPQAYVSPTHYPSKKAHGRVVPTWNYTMVQAEGVARLRDEDDWKFRQIQDLTDQQERSRADVWAVADAPEAFVAAQLRAIVGLEIEVSALRGKFKLSQNRDNADRKGVIAGLAAEDSRASGELAHFMAERQEPRTIG